MLKRLKHYICRRKIAIVEIKVCTVRKNAKFELFFLSNQFFSNLIYSIVKTFLSRNFCLKCVRGNFHNRNCDVETQWINEEFSLTKKISSNQLFSNLFSKTGVNRYFHEIFAKNAQERIPVISTVCQGYSCTVWKNDKFTATQIIFVKLIYSKVLQ